MLHLITNKHSTHFFTLFSTGNEEEQVVLEPDAPKSNSLWGQLSEVQNKAPRRSTGCVSKELEVYKQLCSTCSMEKDLNILSFWRKHEDLLPHLSCIARQYLCIPAGNVASERLGSVTGNTVTNRRTLLSANRAKELVMIKKNFDLLE